MRIAPGDPKKLKDLVLALRSADSKYDPLLKSPQDMLDESLKWMEKKVKRDEGAVFVAEEEKPVGYVFGYIVRRSKKFYKVAKVGYICDLYVQKEYRGKGIGRKLLAAIEKWFAERGINVIELEVYSENPAREFYKKAGYKEESVKMQKVLK